MSATTVLTASARHEASTFPKSMKLAGVLDEFESFDVTPCIGKEFSNVDLAGWLRAPNSDELIRDLAITVAERGVVFFRGQTRLTNDLMKELTQRLGLLSGKPADTGLHIHPVSNSGRKLGGSDDEISVISSEQAKDLFKSQYDKYADKKQSSKHGWHSDISFEPAPADFTIMRATQLPKTGGDTLWASGYEVYDRLSAPYQKFLESLTATYAQPAFAESAQRGGFEMFAGPRGSPLNVGTNLVYHHPVVRTNPVTGWKSVFGLGMHVQKIDGLSSAESDAMKAWLLSIVAENHDLQVRFRYQGEGDMAIWDNRSVFHTATFDYAGLGPRTAQRTVGVAEKPYLDPASKSRREALSEL
ncbi:uncharacterized protein Z520_09007 [Fonsecaea multimorphosa CBS 102226]|uniref:TauD/TfdA-like domain-containing protein n=1 Tax=Fonsecaea multimorphosa CBS 102226 TaxID=1442371 RepID=A0A0D2ID80_9EURO|nr:uncharacterized protein Z520_09007 [Fonsecaea multimorphosa CBS 102226]KIX95091.1 hypothetical protein Z520_09007 [Fonsecaea multimorphosa CBS 102226]OAL20813.1 hypothetical protein AYO22_08441 [Fonsecaea multimorphosa]